MLFLAGRVICSPFCSWTPHWICCHRFLFFKLEDSRTMTLSQMERKSKPTVYKLQWSFHYKSSDNFHYQLQQQYYYKKIVKMDVTFSNRQRRHVKKSRSFHIFIFSSHHVWQRQASNPHVQKNQQNERIKMFGLFAIANSLHSSADGKNRSWSKPVGCGPGGKPHQQTAAAPTSRP